MCYGFHWPDNRNQHLRAQVRATSPTVAASGNKVDWDLVEKLWQVPCGSVALAQRLDLVQGPYRLRRLRQLLDSALRRRGLPSTHVSFIKVPVAEMVPVVRANTVAVFRRCLAPVEATWCLSRLRFLHGGAQTHANSWTHARDAKALDWRNLLATPDHNIQSAISGFNMTYVNKNWDVPLLYKDKVLEKAAHDCVVGAVAKVLSIPARKIHTKKVLALPALTGYCNQRKKRCSAYVVHTHTRHADDKNKKHAWQMPTHVLVCLYLLTPFRFGLVRGILCWQIFHFNKACSNLAGQTSRTN